MKLLTLLLACFITQAVYAEIPRILIINKSGNRFTAEELAVAMDAHLYIFSAKEAEDRRALRVLANEINNLDVANENHRIVLDCTETLVHDIEPALLKLALWTGYDHIQIADMDLAQALYIIKEKELEIPLTDDTLPRTNAFVAGRLYDLMMRVDAIFKAHNIFYWGTTGTLLGAIRHNGLIPWDNNLYIAMLSHDIPKMLALKDVLQQAGLEIYQQKAAGIYKIFPRDGDLIKIDPATAAEFNHQEFFSWRYPFVDIFAMQLTADNKIHYSSDLMRELYPDEYFLPQELVVPQMLVPFGPMLMPIPRNSIQIAERMYTKDWNKTTYAAYDHQHEQNFKKIKVRLTDRSTIPYILPFYTNF